MCLKIILQFCSVNRKNGKYTLLLLGILALFMGLTLEDVVCGQLSDAAGFICLLLFLKMHHPQSESQVEK